MNDDELKILWQQQPLRNPDASAAQLISAMQNKTTQLRRDLRARDVRELVACVFVIIVFGYFFFNERAPIVRLGWLIVVGSSIFIAWKLVHARRTTPSAPPGATIVESLRAELNSVRTQSRLLGSVLWWYLLPYRLAGRHLGNEDQSPRQNPFDAGVRRRLCVRLLAQSAGAVQISYSPRGTTGIAAPFRRNRRTVG